MGRDEKVNKIYGSVLGKIIGVRVGNPLEFLYEDNHVLTSGELQRKYPYISTYIDRNRKTYADDDTNGFVFFAKIFDQVNDTREITREDVAKIILNYATENRGFFWWDKSTEKKAFMNLVNGVSPDKSGSYEYIGDSADTVGGQIFYDATGIVLGGNPEESARCTRLIAGVIHNGEGAIGGSFINACISTAFIEDNVEKIVSTALAFIPENSKYAEMVRNILAFYRKVPYDWKACQHYIEDNYNGHTAYDYGSHIVMPLLYGNGNFSYSMEICLQSGGDTDCNCGNLGAILGAMLGYGKISFENWIKPMDDVLYCSSAVPSENEVSITGFTSYLITLFAKFNNYAVPDYIKNASDSNNLSFVLPYSYQNFHLLMWRDYKLQNDLVNDNNMYVVENEVETPSGSPYSLKIWADSVRKGDCIKIYRWFNIGIFDCDKYEPTSCTKIYSGQTLSVNVMTRYNTAKMKLRLSVYSQIEDKTDYSEYFTVETGKWKKLEYRIPKNISSFYDCVNIEAVMTENSYYKHGYDGIDLYTDDFRISGKPRYAVKFSHTGRLIEEHYWYTLMRNFNICYGTAYQGKDYVRFFSGYGDMQQNSHYQEISEKKQFALALTGTEVYDCTFCCEMSVLPEDTGAGQCDGNASLLEFGAKGASDYYAAGFCNGRMAILKSDMAGEFTELVSEPYDYDCHRRYYIAVTVDDGHIEFTVQESDNTYKFIGYSTGTEQLKGCIGFAGLGEGITVYKYGIM